MSDPTSEQPVATPVEAGTDPAEWVDRHGDALYRYALLRLRDAELAEDIVQESLLAALDARDSFTGRSSERTWLIGILKRKVIDYVRRTTREPTHEGEQDDHYEKKAFDAKGFWALTPRPVGRRSGFRHGERRILDCFSDVPGESVPASCRGLSPPGNGPDGKRGCLSGFRAYRD